MFNIDAYPIIEAYNNGESTYSIAKRFNTYPTQVNRILHKYGVVLRDKGKAQKEALKSGRALAPGKYKKKDRKI